MLIRNVCQPKRRAVLAAFAVASLVGAASPLSAASPRITGFLDPATGQFTARIQPGPDAAAALRNYSGTIVLNLTITLASSLPGSATITCEASVGANDPSFARAYNEGAQVAATRSGSTATCSLSIPYSWNLASGSTYTVGYDVFTLGTSNLVPRTSQLIETAGNAIPPSAGKVTTIAFAVTL